MCWKIFAKYCDLIPEAAEIMSSAILIDCGAITDDHPALVPKAVELDPLLTNMPNLAFCSQWNNHDNKHRNCIILVSNKFDNKAKAFHTKNSLNADYHKLNIWLFDIMQDGPRIIYGTALQIILYVSKRSSTTADEFFPSLTKPSSFVIVDLLNFYNNKIISNSALPGIVNFIQQSTVKIDANVLGNRFIILLIWLFDAWRINRVEELSHNKFVIL